MRPRPRRSVAHPGCRGRRDHVGGTAVGLLDEVGMDVRRRRGVPMAEPAGNGADVHPRTQQLRGDEVSEIVQPNVGAATGCRSVDGAGPLTFECACRPRG